MDAKFLEMLKAHKAPDDANFPTPEEASAAWTRELRDRLNEARKTENWEEFVNLGTYYKEVMDDAFQYFDMVPDNLKYKFAISSYTSHGDSLPSVRRAVRKAKSYGKPDLPDEIKDLEVVDIYRAGEEKIDKSKHRISWTLSLERAVWFYKKYNHRHANYIYKGKIRTADIIAYTNQRQEQEVMQYGSVFDVEDITESAKNIDVPDTEPFYLEMLK